MDKQSQQSEKLEIRASNISAMSDAIYFAIRDGEDIPYVEDFGVVPAEFRQKILSIQQEPHALHAYAFIQSFIVNRVAELDTDESTPVEDPEDWLDGLSPQAIATDMMMAHLANIDSLYADKLGGRKLFVPLMEKAKQGDKGVDELVEFVRTRIVAFNTKKKKPGVIEKYHNEQEEAEGLRRLIRNKVFHYGCLGSVIVGIPALAITGAVGATTAAKVINHEYSEAERVRGQEQRRIDDIVKYELTERYGALSPSLAKMMELDGARIQFVCKAQEIKLFALNGDEATLRYWEPVNALEEWQPRVLEKRPFNVSFGKHRGNGIDYPTSQDVARAGWGTTISFTPDQSLVNTDVRLGAVQIIDDVGELTTLGSYIPGSVFVQDPDQATRYKYSTGEMARDGYRLSYFMIDNAGEFACDGLVPEDADEVMKVDATLVLQMEEKGLKHFVDRSFYKETIDPDGTTRLEGIPSPDYVQQFNSFDPELGAWYESIYPGFIRLWDLGMRNASRNGIKDKDLLPIAEYVYKRLFEQNLIQFLQYVKSNTDDETLAFAVERLKGLRSPTVNFGEHRELSRRMASGSCRPVAPGSPIHFDPFNFDPNVAAHEFFHAWFQYPEAQTPMDLYWEDENPEFGAIDTPYMEGAVEYFSQMAVGSLKPQEEINPSKPIAYRGGVRFAQLIAEDYGQLEGMLEFSLLHPTMELSRQDEALFTSWGIITPTRETTAHLYALVLKATDVHKASEGKQAEIRNLFEKMEELRDLFLQLNGGRIDYVKMDQLLEEVNAHLVNIKDLK